MEALTQFHFPETCPRTCSQEVRQARVTIEKALNHLLQKKITATGPEDLHLVTKFFVEMLEDHSWMERHKPTVTQVLQAINHITLHSNNQKINSTLLTALTTHHLFITKLMDSESNAPASPEIVSLAPVPTRLQFLHTRQTSTIFTLRGSKIARESFAGSVAPKDQFATDARNFWKAPDFDSEKNPAVKAQFKKDIEAIKEEQERLAKLNEKRIALEKKISALSGKTDGQPKIEQKRKEVAEIDEQIAASLDLLKNLHVKVENWSTLSCTSLFLPFSNRLGAIEVAGVKVTGWLQAKLEEDVGKWEDLAKAGVTRFIDLREYEKARKTAEDPTKVNMSDYERNFATVLDKILDHPIAQTLFNQHPALYRRMVMIYLHHLENERTVKCLRIETMIKNASLARAKIASFLCTKQKAALQKTRIPNATIEEIKEWSAGRVEREFTKMGYESGVTTGNLEAKRAVLLLLKNPTDDLLLFTEQGNCLFNEFFEKACQKLKLMIEASQLIVLDHEKFILRATNLSDPMHILWEPVRKAEDVLLNIKEFKITHAHSLMTQKMVQGEASGVQNLFESLCDMARSTIGFLYPNKETKGKEGEIDPNAERLFTRLRRIKYSLNFEGLEHLLKDLADLIT